MTTQDKLPGKRTRKRKENSLTKLAEKCGVTVAHISHIKAGRRGPSLTIARKMAAAMDMSMEELAVWVQKRREKYKAENQSS